MELSSHILNLVGRYQCEEHGAYKFWQVKAIKEDTYLVSWGRIGYPAQSSMELNEKLLIKKIKEKQKKKYTKINFPELDNYHQKLLLEECIDTVQSSKKKFKI